MSRRKTELTSKCSVMGVPHCPICNEMLWPPEDTDTLRNEHGERLDSILDAEPGRPVFHDSCYPSNPEHGSIR